MSELNLERLWADAEKKIASKHLIVVCNTKIHPNMAEDRGLFNMDTEYFSDDEFEQIVSMFNSLGLVTDYFTYEDDFFRNDTVLRIKINCYQVLLVEFPIRSH